MVFFCHFVLEFIYHSTANNVAQVQIKGVTEIDYGLEIVDLGPINSSNIRIFRASIAIIRSIEGRTFWDEISGSGGYTNSVELIA